MKKILFVVRELRMEPLGIMYLSTALTSAGHSVMLAREDFGEKPSTIVAVYKPDFVCYSICSGSEDHYFTLDDNLHRENPDVPFKSLYGGPAVTFNPGEFVGRNCIRGEGEKAIVDFVEGREVKELTLVDINALPMPDRAQVYRFSDMLADPIKNIISRRGCKYGCAYCFERNWRNLHKGQGWPIRVRDVKNVVEEAVQLKTYWQPLKMINFVDDNFADPVEWLREFSPLYKEKVGVPFFCSIRPEDFTEEVARLIAEAGGAVVDMAIETANDEHRHLVLARVGEKDTVRKAVGLCKKHGLRVRLQNIIGLPVPDPLADAFETLDFNISVNPTSSWCAILQAYKGTRIYDIAKRLQMAPEDGKVDEGFFGISTLLIKDRRLIERLHKLWPVITAYPVPLRWIAKLLIRIPAPFSWYRWFFKVTKKWLAERDLWKVF